MTITLASGKKQVISVTVQKTTVRTTKITGLKSSVTVARNKKLTLKPVISPITSQEKVTYSSSNKKIATVSSSGVITGKKKGTAYITVKSGKIRKKVESKTQDDKISFGESLKLLFSNKYYILIVAIYIVYYFMSNLTTGSAVYFMKQVLGDGSLLGLFSMMKMFPVIIALIFTPILVKKTGSMQKVNFWGYVISDILGIFLIFFAMQKNLPMMLLFMFLKGTFAGTMSGTLNALIAEISGYTYRTKGVHIDGMMFSCSSLGVKVGGGIGTAAVGWLLNASGYVGTAATQTSGAINMIFSMYITIPVILGVVITVLLGLMTVEKENKRMDMEREANN